MRKQDFENSMKQLIEEFSIYGISLIIGTQDGGLSYELPQDERTKKIGQLLVEKFTLEDLLSTNSFSSDKDKANALNELFAIKRKLTNYKAINENS